MFCPAEIMLLFNVCNKYSSQLVCVLILFFALNIPFHSSAYGHFSLTLVLSRMNWLFRQRCKPMQLWAFQNFTVRYFKEQPGDVFNNVRTVNNYTSKEDKLHLLEANSPIYSRKSFLLGRGVMSAQLLLACQQMGVRAENKKLFFNKS